ncbi:DUF2207 domain-containing protein [Subtercola endophyticus]|uniref:DUF2207 domain-containing protein n=1 Tax=Subtercola endophyticus TaxID=2895559 RepID=UPI001E4782D6|nr:DUF2207 domain-containing protein [Subtercola endophyticus]UFS60582.1 DUF2207 domain-containing protein [Subtercola endophyticus]
MADDDSEDKVDDPTDAGYYRAEADASERIPAPAPKQTWLWVVLSRWLLRLEGWLRSHGGRGLRIGLRVFWGAVAIAGVALLVGPVINPPLTLDDITHSASTVTDRWIARDFAADYQIARNAQGELVAHVTENISATFPDGTDESGIQRVLATEYQSHALNPSNVQATLDGAPVEVGVSHGADQETLTIDGSGQLQGDHEFVLQYDLENLAYSSTDTATGQATDLLRWDVFGPSWPQGFAGLDVKVTIPKELDDRLIRQPRGTLAWTLLSAGQWLSPEPSTAGSTDVTYHFSNDQNIPPHAQAAFSMSFEPGTFSMPAPTPLYFVQVWGPLAPLIFLAITLLLALAARAVAWSDARGRPWFVAQSDPPKDITARMAAQIIRSPAALELADALASAQGVKAKATRRNRLIAAARVAERTGRIGDRPRALRKYLAAPERGGQLTAGLRRIPRGFVRDLFIAAPPALTIVQWGLVRQLSFQTRLAVVWWPVAFVLVSSVIALIVLTIALTARPLTRRGALVKQYLLGIGVYADRTKLLDRDVTSDRVLPYAVLLAPPREAGDKTATLIENELGDSAATKGWRTGDFLTGPRLIIRTLAVLVVALAIGAAAALPYPFPRSPDYLSYSGDIPGTLDTSVSAMDVVATLSRTSDRHARIDVTEKLTVAFSDEGSQVPQFAQEWPSVLNGQSLGMTVASVTLDGAAVPFATEQRSGPNGGRDDGAGTLLMHTMLRAVVTGSHAVQISYSLQSAAVAAQATAGEPGTHAGQVVDRVRWAALLDGWESDSQWGDHPVPSPLRVSFRLSDELAALASDAGWISLDTTPDNYQDWTHSVLPFGALADESDAGQTTESSTSAEGSQTHVLDLKADANDSLPFDVTVDDLGAGAVFPAGTFAGPSESRMRVVQVESALPIVAVLSLAALGLGLGVAGIVLGAARRRRAFAAGPVRDAVWWLAPASALAATILFVWATSDMPADDLTFIPLALGSVAALLASAAGLILTRRSRATRQPRKGAPPVAD